MRIRVCATLLAALLLLALAAAPESWAATLDLRLEIPQRVARGDAFTARAVSLEPVQSITFQWRGKSHQVPARSEQGAYVAEMLLAVPVDEAKAAALSLEARAARSRAQGVVSLYSKDRPVQKLNVDPKYVDPPAHEMERIKADREKVRAATAVFNTEQGWRLPLLRPVPGSVSSLYGLKRVFNGQPRSVHKGLDLRGAEGTPIAAAADGVVVLADNLYYSGNAVYLDHGLGVFTAYLHMSQSHVRPGQQVRRGETIGLVGATGRVTGPHLHLSMLVQGVPVDPQPLMESPK